MDGNISIYIYPSIIVYKGFISVWGGVLIQIYMYICIYVICMYKELFKFISKKNITIKKQAKYLDTSAQTIYR